VISLNSIPSSVSFTTTTFPRFPSYVSGVSVNSIKETTCDISLNSIYVPVSFTYKNLFSLLVYVSGTSSKFINLNSIGINWLFYSSIYKICLSNPVKSFGTSVNSLNAILSNIMPSSVSLTLNNLYYELS